MGYCTDCGTPVTPNAIDYLLQPFVPNIQSTWATQGLKVLQMGLRFGSNDVGSVMPEPGTSTTESSASLLTSLHLPEHRPFEDLHYYLP